MNFFSKKDLVYTVVMSVLVLCAAFFCIKAGITEEKYQNYRGSIINRGIEGSIQLLGEYVKTEDPTLSSLISSRLNELPLSSEERMSVSAFCADVSRSENDENSKARALFYASELIACLRDNREAIKRGDTSSFPLYEGDVPAFGEEERPYFKEAQRLLGVADPRPYKRGEITGYRTARSYAEFSDGALVRYLCYREGEDAVSLDDARNEAAVFAKKYANEAEIVSESAENGAFSFVFDTFYIDVSLYGGVMRFERTKF